MVLRTTPWSRFAWVGILACVLSSTGCVGTLAQISRMTGGDLVPAEYEGLEDKTVAVVVVSAGSNYGPGTEATMIGTAVEQLLRQNIDGIKLVSQDKIADWADQNDWNEVDPEDIGKGVKADMVISVDIGQFSLTDGPTLFKGRSEYGIKLLDMSETSDKVVWSKTPPMYEFPKSGRYRDTTSRSKFERQYITKLSQQIARHFYPYPYAEDFATDAEFLD